MVAPVQEYLFELHGVFYLNNLVCYQEIPASAMFLFIYELDLVLVQNSGDTSKQLCFLDHLLIC